MDGKKELNEEELEQVTGGIAAAYANSNGSKAAIQSNKVNCPEANGWMVAGNKAAGFDANAAKNSPA